MAEFPALQLWTDAYLADTTDLSAEEHGAYLLLLMAAWRTKDCSLPDDDKRLARMARVGTKKWRNIRPVMARFWTVGDNKWTQKRLLLERKRSEMWRSQKVEAGKASALKRKETAPTDVATEPPTENQPPLPNNLNPSEAKASSGARQRGSRLPDDWTLSDEWRDWAVAKHGWPVAKAELEGEKFGDWAHQQPGKKGVKLDWFAAWRNWTRSPYAKLEKPDREKPADTTIRRRAGLQTAVARRMAGKPPDNGGDAGPGQGRTGEMGTGGSPGGPAGNSGPAGANPCAVRSSGQLGRDGGILPGSPGGCTAGPDPEGVETRPAESEMVPETERVARADSRGTDAPPGNGGPAGINAGARGLRTATGGGHTNPGGTGKAGKGNSEDSRRPEKPAGPVRLVEAKGGLNTMPDIPEFLDRRGKKALGA